jgi:putative CocE/NonD family hydrolase
MMNPNSTGRLLDLEPELERLLTYSILPPARFSVSDIECKTVWASMRDGTRLATELYLPPNRPAPVVVVRTPYDRNAEERGFVAALLFFARRGYVAVSQDCRGTGASEPDSWDYCIYESEDGYDCVEWITRQEWYGGLIVSFGNSYAGQTQWPMAQHPAMSTTVPGFSGLGVAANTAHLYMFLNAYARTIGKGKGKVKVHLTEMERVYEMETMGGGYFNEPLHVPFSAALLTRIPNLHEMQPLRAKRWLWEQYAALDCRHRAEFVKQALGVHTVTSVDVESLPAIFGQTISHDALMIPHASRPELCRTVLAPPLLRTGWYDWCLNDALATWEMLRREGLPGVAARARLLITPYAHNLPGYHEGVGSHPELMRAPNLLEYVAVLLRWYEAVREGKTAAWPTVIYYLMGANEWRVADDWPAPGACEMTFYLGEHGSLTTDHPTSASLPDHYVFDPTDPTPTVGGSIVSFVYPPGSVDVSDVQQRPDVRVYSSAPLERDLDVVGSLRLILYASSSAVDTDFVGRLSDVFPDGRAIQLQSGILRARYRNLEGEPELLEPGRVYRFEIDLWATANRFKAGHRLRVDISSADFPHFDRNSNRGGEPGDPISARQTLYHDSRHPSHLIVSVLNHDGPSCEIEEVL